MSVTEPLVTAVASASLPTEYGEFTVNGYRDATGAEHAALVCGEIADGQDVLVRVHSECLTGDALGSLRCDCGPQLRAALRAVTESARGVVVYLKGHEGRGIGLVHKLAAYRLQEDGHDTVDANLALGLPADARDWGVAAAILADLGVRSLRLLTNNPAKRDGLLAHGLDVLAVVPLTVPANPHNAAYLRAKAERLGHVL